MSIFMRTVTRCFTKNAMNRNKRIKASTTVELSYIMPVIFFVFLVVIYIGFYFHDKNVINGLIYEASIIGTSNYRNEGEVNLEEIELFLIERAAIRLLFFPEPDIEVSVAGSNLSICAESKNGVMSMEVVKTYPLLEIESKIREAMRIEEVVEETVNGSRN